MLHWLSWRHYILTGLVAAFLIGTVEGCGPSPSSSPQTSKPAPSTENKKSKDESKPPQADPG
jgi:hypothetical protein